MFLLISPRRFTFLADPPGFFFVTMYNWIEVYGYGYEKRKGSQSTELQTEGKIQ